MLIQSSVRQKNFTKQVHLLLAPDDHANLKEVARSEGLELSSFIRRAIGNELDRLNSYTKEKSQTWDLD